jgi:hypothetical protein
VGSTPTRFRQRDTAAVGGGTVADLLGSARSLVGGLIGRRFSHVVPLGASCRVTWQLRTFFRDGRAYPFDWWASTVDGLAAYLSVMDPARIYGDGGLEELVVDGRVTTIRSREFGFQLFHEFPRHRDVSGASAVSPGWEAHVAAAAQRHTHRLERLRGLDRTGNRILFVRHKYAYEPGPAGDPAASVARLLAALEAGWSRARFTLLLINFPEGYTPPAGVLSVRFDDPPGPAPEEWRGDGERWEAAFRSLGLSLDASPAEREERPPGTYGPPN